MIQNRKDIWTPDEDQTLASIVLSYIRDGKTQLNAFKTVGENIGRTAAACGFRWNGDVRKRFEESINEAKRERLKKKSRQKGNVLPFSTPGTPESIMEISDLLASILQLAESYKSQIHTQQETISALRSQLLNRDEEILILKEQAAKNAPSDLETLMGIMDRARSLGIIERTQH
ncbi:hypothetical protein [Paenibacillus sp. MMO-58]|uniref:hypothetical protein n=1 Tax=Paenibacillus sp. MMO-58 TaxID=3081290 RepID=UPI00301A6E01